MEYDVTIVCAANDYYLGEAVCRELEKRGKRCLFNWRDEKEPEKIGGKFVRRMSGNYVAILSNDLLKNGLPFKTLSEFQSKKKDIVTYLLQNDDKVSIPNNWKKYILVDARKGLTPEIVDCVAEGLEPSEALLISPAIPGKAKSASPASTTKNIATNSVAQSEPSSTGTIATQDSSDSYHWENQRHVVDTIVDMMIPVDGASLTVQRAMKYLVGDGIPQDSERAYSLFNKAFSENAEDVLALYYLGACLETGCGVEQDMNKANEYFSKAATLGHTPSMYRNGILLMLLSEGTESNESVELFKNALSKNDVRGAFGLGLYNENAGNYEEAFENYCEAAEMGYAPAQNAVGCLYSDGMGVKESEEKALQWFALAAEQGLVEAMANYGVRLFGQDGEAEKKGESLLREAAEMGNVAALNLVKRIDIAAAEEQKRREAEEKRRREEQESEEQFDAFLGVLGRLGSSAINKLGGGTERHISDIF